MNTKYIKIMNIGEISLKKAIIYSLLSSSLLLTACANTEEPDVDSATDAVTEETGTEEISDDAKETSTGVTIKTMYGAPHGDKSFASTFVVMDGDRIVEVFQDEYQFIQGGDVTGVPNSDAKFGDGSVEEVTLISKQDNNTYYSEMMESAGSTVSYSDNLTAIAEFAEGKTIAEVEEKIAELNGLGEDDNISDVVSGATLVDTSGYLQAIVDTANEGLEFVGVEEANLENAELSYSLQAPHGEQSFAVVSVLHDGDTVLAATMDEFQFVDPADFEGVPNSDGSFGESYNENVVLASKLQNDDAYSAMMTEHAGATHTYAENMQAIIDHAVGSTVEEIEATITELSGLGEDDDISDVVSGATFVDTLGYLQAIVDTMKN